MKVKSYKAHVLFQPEKGRYFAELWVNGIRETYTAGFLSEKVAIMKLNQRILAFNTMNGTRIPPYKEGETNQMFTKPKEEQTMKQPKNTKAADIQPTTPAKPIKPKRKPFTPYGLNGYLVDKQGNVRLHLNRRANAHTIVLAPEMFSALADMVQKTQEQVNG